MFSSAGEGTAETAQTAPCQAESNQHPLSFELHSISTTLPPKSSSHDHTPDSGLPTEADVLLSPGNPDHANSRVTGIIGDSTPLPHSHDVQFGNTESREGSASLVGQTAQPTASHQEQQKQVLEMPYKFSGFPSTAFKISPMSGILGRLLPLQNLRHFSSVSSSGQSSSEHHSPSTEVREEMMDLGIDLDDEVSLTHANVGVEVTPLAKEEESREGSATVDPSPEKMGEGEHDVSRSSFLAMDVEGLLLETCSKSVSKGVWATYPSKAELSSDIDAERVHLEHRTKQKQQKYHSKRVGGPSGRDQTDRAGSGAAVKKKRVRDRKKVEEEEEEGEEGGGGAVGQRGKGKSKKPKKPSPNAFIAVRIPSSHIRSGLDAVQKGMLEKEKLIRSTLTSLKKLHITLSVIRLEKGDEER